MVYPCFDGAYIFLKTIWLIYKCTVISYIVIPLEYTREYNHIVYTNNVSTNENA